MATRDRSLARDRSLVRASDLSAWAYCQRAWWLAHVQKAAHEAPERLALGTQSHHRHGALVGRALFVRRAGLVLLGLAAVAALVALATLI